MTEEIADEVLSDIYAFLANRVEKTEEEEEDAAEEALDQAEEKPEEQELAQGKKTDGKNQQKAQKQAETPKAAGAEKQETPQVVIQQAPAGKAGKSASPITSRIISQEAQTNVIAKSPAESPAINSAEPSAGALNKSEATLSLNNHDTTGTLASSKPAEVMILEPAISESTEVTEPEISELEAIGFSKPEVPDADLGLSAEVIELIESGPEAAEIEYRTPPDNSGIFLESEDIIISHFEPGPQPEDLEFSRPDEEPGESYFELTRPVYDREPADIVELDQVAGNELAGPPGADLEAVKDVLAQLADSMEMAGPEVAETAAEILDKIVKVPVELDPGVAGTVIGEEQTQAELDELFTELLEIMEIDYTPELIEPLAKLAIRHQLQKEIAKKLEILIDETPREQGTFEIITEWLAVLNNNDEATARRTNALGWLALELALAGPAQISHPVYQRAA